MIVGGVAMALECARSSHRLLKPSQTDRLTTFFPELNHTTFESTLDCLGKEWDRIEKMVIEEGETVDQNVLFESISRPREGMIRYRPRGTVLSNDIENWLDQSFDTMVLRKPLQDSRKLVPSHSEVVDASC